jgi:hypothetical protein
VTSVSIDQREPVLARLLDAVEGAVLVDNSLATPELRATVAAGLADYVRGLVDDQLWALRAGPHDRL